MHALRCKHKRVDCRIFLLHPSTNAKWMGGGGIDFSRNWKKTCFISWWTCYPTLHTVAHSNQPKPSGDDLETNYRSNYQTRFLTIAPFSWSCLSCSHLVSNIWQRQYNLEGTRSSKIRASQLLHDMPFFPRWSLPPLSSFKGYYSGCRFQLARIIHHQAAWGIEPHGRASNRKSE